MTCKSALSCVSVLLSSLMLMSCSDMQQLWGKAAIMQTVAADTAADHAAYCKTHADKRFSLFDRPDAYPVSVEERRNAKQALFTECMKQYDVQVASPKPGFQVSPAGSELAGLSPAAGGDKNGQPKGGVISYPNGTIVIDTAHLGSLTPAAGGKVGTATSGGSTVVVVQAASAGMAAPITPAAPVKPAAIPLDANGQPLKDASAPAPKALVEGQYNPPKTPVIKAETTKKQAKKKVTPKQETADPDDKRTRFQKNAVPVTIDLGGKKQDANALAPSAGGHVLDKDLNTNKLPPKE